MQEESCKEALASHRSEDEAFRQATRAVEACDSEIWLTWPCDAMWLWVKTWSQP